MLVVVPKEQENVPANQRKVFPPTPPCRIEIAFPAFLSAASLLLRAWCSECGLDRAVMTCTNEAVHRAAVARNE